MLLMLNLYDRVDSDFDSSLSSFCSSQLFLGESENSAVSCQAVFTNMCSLPKQVGEPEHTNLHYSERKHANHRVGCVKTTREGVRLRRPNRFNSVLKTKANLQVVEQKGVLTKDGPAKENKSRNGPRHSTPKPRSMKVEHQNTGRNTQGGKD